MQWIISLDKGLAKISYLCGWIASAAFVLMLFNVFFDVVSRYVFNEVSIGMQEMEWHLYAAVFLLGIPFALRTDGHVRVDVLYDRWSDHFKAWVDLVGAVIFVIPFAMLIGYYGYDYALESYNLGEGSGDPGGLPYRWIIKSLIVFSAVFTATSGLGMVTRSLRVIKLGEKYTSNTGKGGLA
ncbi:TRAP transporter small permease subunit [Marinobacter caseinilyticus]|uniref:TRAP transporter small permease subunit n=1 Tax=Marinobacter caseinilyticus TaxID=2692195 RepID=UPI00140E1310|nr:TRAP transporter small permease subunit [Marinobacter caseinilyticus]